MASQADEGEEAGDQPRPGSGSEGSASSDDRSSDTSSPKDAFYLDGVLSGLPLRRSSLDESEVEDVDDEEGPQAGVRGKGCAKSTVNTEHAGAEASTSSQRDAEEIATPQAQASRQATSGDTDRRRKHRAWNVATGSPTSPGGPSTARGGGGPFSLADIRSLEILRMGSDEKIRNHYVSMTTSPSSSSQGDRDEQANRDEAKLKGSTQPPTSPGSTFVSKSEATLGSPPKYRLFPELRDYQAPAGRVPALSPTSSHGSNDGFVGATVGLTVGVGDNTHVHAPSPGQNSPSGRKKIIRGLFRAGSQQLKHRLGHKGRSSSKGSDSSLGSSTSETARPEGSSFTSAPRDP